MQGTGFLFLLKPNSLRLLPGEAVTALSKLPGEPLAGVIIPRDAVVRTEGVGWVYVLNEGGECVHAHAQSRWIIRSKTAGSSPRQCGRGSRGGDRRANAAFGGIEGFAQGRLSRACSTASFIFRCGFAAWSSRWRACSIGYGIYVAAHAKLDVFPNFVPPQVVVQTEAPGLSPEQVEVLVTRPHRKHHQRPGQHGIAALRIHLRACPSSPRCSRKARTSSSRARCSPKS